MTELEKENEDLKSYVKQLKESNAKNIQTITKLNSININLSSTKDTSNILENILLSIKEFTNADAGTIYIADGDKLTFKHVLNETLHIEKKQKISTQDEDDVWNYLELKEQNKHMVAVRCALNKEIIRISNIDNNIDNAFKKKTGYEDKTMLVVPMINDNEELVGVIQLINKKDIDSSIIHFSDEDESFAHSLASQASIAVNRFKQNQLLMQQSRLASMGEMIDAIAHQWKQPLTVIDNKMLSLMLKLEMKREIKEDDLKELACDVDSQIKHLVATLDEFRSYYRLDKVKEHKNISKLIEKVLLLMKDDIYLNNIQIEITGDKNLGFNIIENEMIHIFINLITNAKDAFNSNNITDKKITFHIKEAEDYLYIDTSDTAGGIPEELIPKIFKANFTTKEKGKGTGIGLYMSTQIAQTNNGELSVQNIGSGARFRLKIAK